MVSAVTFGADGKEKEGGGTEPDPIDEAETSAGVTGCWACKVSMVLLVVLGAGGLSERSKCRKLTGGVAGFKVQLE